LAIVFQHPPHSQEFRRPPAIILSFAMLILDAESFRAAMMEWSKPISVLPTTPVYVKFQGTSRGVKGVQMNESLFSLHRTEISAL